MKYFLPILMAVVFVLSAQSASAETVDMICTIPGESTEYVVPVEINNENRVIVDSAATSQPLAIRTSVDRCFESLDEIQPTCFGGAITSTERSGSCTTVVCESASESIQAQACEKDQFLWFGPTHIEVYRQSPTTSTTSLEVCFGDNCVGQWGYAESPDVPYCRDEAEFSEADLSCIQAVQQGKLTASLDGNTATIRSTADQDYVVSVATYAQFNRNVVDQELVDFATGTVPSNSDLELVVDFPACGWQADIVCGDSIIEDLEDDNLYGDRKIYWEYSQGLDFCVQGQNPQSGASQQPVVESDEQSQDEEEPAQPNTSTNTTTNVSVGVDDEMTNQTPVIDADVNSSVNVSVDNDDESDITPFLDEDNELDFNSSVNISN